MPEWIGGLFAPVLVAAAVYFATQGGTDGLAPTSAAAAAERTSAEPGGSIETEITYKVAGESKSVTATGAGVFDGRSGRAQLELSVPGARYAADYRHYLSIDAEQAEWILARARVYQLGSAKIPGTEGHEAEEETQDRELKRLATKLGIQPCERLGATPGPSQVS